MLKRQYVYRDNTLTHRAGSGVDWIKLDRSIGYHSKCMYQLNNMMFDR